MNNLNKVLKINQYTKLYIYSIITILSYMGFLWPFYVKNYEVPDYFLYAGFAEQNLPAKHGFSSMFLFMMRFAYSHFKYLQLSALISMCLGIFGLLFFYIKLYKPTSTKYFLVLLTIISSNFLYYFYGKVVYDFPYTFGTFGIILILTSIYIFKPNNFKRILLYVLIGFLLSWKPYNIFLLYGLLVIILTFEPYKSSDLLKLNSSTNIVSAIIAILFGFILGNFNLITKFSETLVGINGYPANSSLLNFIFTTRLEWDHVYTPPFIISTTNISIFFTLLFMIVRLKKYFLLFLNIVFILLFKFYLNFFSPGYTWHGFVIGAYLILLFILLLDEYYETFKSKQTIIFLTTAILIQVIYSFAFYIPKQISFFKTTEVFVNSYIENSTELSFETNKLITDLNSTYIVELPIHREYIVRDYIYGPQFTYSLLRVGDNDKWNDIYSKMDLYGPQYKIYIYPNDWYLLDEVALYSENDLVDVYLERKLEDFTFFVVKLWE